MASPIDHILALLEKERTALLDTAFVLPAQRHNIIRYTELLLAPTAYGNAPKKRAQDVLGVVQEYSNELFVLCALATNQNTLGSVKWPREDIANLIKWWESSKKPLTSLESIWQSVEQQVQNLRKSARSSATSASNSNNPALSSDQTLPINTQQLDEAETVMIKISWLIEALKGKEDKTLVLTRNPRSTSTIELTKEIEQSIRMAEKMRGVFGL